VAVSGFLTVFSCGALRRNSPDFAGRMAVGAYHPGDQR